MPIVSKTTLKSYFNQGDVPNESNYIDLIDTIPNDSDYHRKDSELVVQTGVVRVGILDTLAGSIDLYGSGSGNEGGEIRLHLGSDHDASFDVWVIDVYEDDLRIYPSSAAFSHKFKNNGDLQLSLGLSVPGNASIGGELTIGSDFKLLQSGWSQVRSSTQVAFLSADGSQAQNASFKGIQISDSYTGNTPTNGITFGTDTNLYRSGANYLKTDDSLSVMNTLAIGDYFKVKQGTKVVANNTAVEVLRIMVDATYTPWSGWLKVIVSAEPSAGVAYCTATSEYIIPIRWYWEGGVLYFSAAPTIIRQIDNGSKNAGYMDITVPVITTAVYNVSQGISIFMKANVSPGPATNVRFNYVAEFYTNNAPESIYLIQV